MNEACKECIQVEEIKRRLSVIENNNERFEGRITSLERGHDVTIEKVNMIFNVLNEIKDSIKKISDRFEVDEKDLIKDLKKQNEKPINLVWGGIAVAIGSVITYVITLILK